MSKCGPVLLLLLAALAPLRADVTIWYNTSGGGATAPNAAPRQMVVRIRGNVCYSEMNGMASLLDVSKNLITLVDRQNRRFSTVPAEQFFEAAAAGMRKLPQRQMNSAPAFRFDVSSKKTGRTAVLHGMNTEETEVVISVDMPPKPGLAPMTMQIVFDRWQAGHDEIARMPAFRELTAITKWSGYFMNPGAILHKAFGNNPAAEQFGKDLASAFAPGDSVDLRTQIELRMPSVNTPLMHYVSEVSRISTAPLQPSLFRVPDGYLAVPFLELLGAGARRGTM
jgi:hypothetical protein